MDEEQFFATEKMYEKILPELQNAFIQLESAVPPPKQVMINGGFAYRYAEKQPQQAIVMKFARVVSGIQATWHLLQEGFTQEAASMQRILDELNSDIQFLAGSIIFGSEESTHTQFLSEFFQEEFDDRKTALESQQKRHRVPRQKIRAYNARMFSSPNQVSIASEVTRTIENANSGYIHAAGTHIMDMYGGILPHFHIDGMKATPIYKTSLDNFRNYLIRSLLIACFTAKALDHDKLEQLLLKKSDEIAKKNNLY